MRTCSADEQLVVNTKFIHRSVLKQSAIQYLPREKNRGSCTRSLILFLRFDFRHFDFQHWDFRDFRIREYSHHPKNITIFHYFQVLIIVNI